MKLSEIDTFYFKFKNLLLAEKNATLTLKAEEGRVPLVWTLATFFLELSHSIKNLIAAEMALPEFDAVNDLQKQDGMLKLKRL